MNLRFQVVVFLFCVCLGEGISLEDSFSGELCLTEECHETEREAVKKKKKAKYKKYPVIICIYFSGVNQKTF